MWWCSGERMRTRTTEDKDEDEEEDEHTRSHSSCEIWFPIVAVFALPWFYWNVLPMDGGRSREEGRNREEAHDWEQERANYWSLAA
eukprot:3343038-Rhodomonas_salina.5